MSLTIQNKPSGNFEPVTDGIHPAVCLAVLSLGPVAGSFQGKANVKDKIKIVWEVEELTNEKVRKTISKNYTASLHPKAQLNRDLSGWRGKSIAANESIEMDKLVGACCTLVIKTEEVEGGKKYTGIDTVSKATKKFTASGKFDKNAALTRIREYSKKTNSAHNDAVFAEQLGEAVEAPATTAEDDGDLAPEVTEDDVAF